MKKIQQLFFIILTSVSCAVAQIDPQMMDLLNAYPTKNAAQLQKNAEQMAALGKTGIVQLALNAHPNRSYALSGFSYFITQNGKENWRKIATEAYCEALEKTTDKTFQAFLIFQLQQIGKEAAVATLSKFLSDNQLNGPSARALGKIGTASAAKALLQALPTSTGANQIAIVQALGDGRFGEATTVIAPLITTADLYLKKVVFYALSQIGSPASHKILQEAAAKVFYGYEETNATSSYLVYLSRLTETGNTALAEKLTKKLLKETANVSQMPTRTAALKIVTDIQGQESTTTLLATLKNPDMAYRAAALKFAQKHLNPTTIDVWVKALPRQTSEIQVEIIEMLGLGNAKTALPTIINFITDKDETVRRAAIKTAAKIGQQSVLKDLLTVLRKGNAEEVKAVKAALMSMKGDKVVEQITTALRTMPSAAQVAIIEVLASRSAAEAFDVVWPELKNNNVAVRTAAFTALKDVTTSKNLNALFVLLHTLSEPQEIVATQDAIATNLPSVGDAVQQATFLFDKMNYASPFAKPSYLRLLAGVGGKKALQSTVSTFTTGDAITQKAALDALVNWRDESALPELYKIGKTTSNATYVAQVIGGYVRAVNTFNQTPTKKGLLLQKVMEIAQTVVQKESILKELSKYPTFNTLVFVGKYLENNQLQQVSAQAVTNIALANKDFHGEVVRTLLNKAVVLLTNDEQKKAIQKHLAEMPLGDGFVSLFNGKDLTGWKGLVGNPLIRAKMHPDTLAIKQQKADEIMRKGWFVNNDELVFAGQGENLCTIKKYADFEMYVDWKIEPKGDAGIYLRGSPQVQVWDTSRTDVGAQVGSGGLYNNQKHPSKPLKLADNAIGEWNTFHIIMQADRVTVRLNGELVVDNVILENYWDRTQPIFPVEQLELQAHGTLVAYRNIYIRELPRKEPFALSQQEKKEGFKVLFDGTNLFEWTGNTTDYVIENGDLVVYPNRGGKGNLYTKDQYTDFDFRFEFLLTPGANNGLGIRAPLEGDAAYLGTELQILDNDADKYKSLQPYQYHGSAYGVIAAKRGFLKPTGEWNYQEVVVKGTKIQVTLNGTVILEGDLAEASKNGTLDHREHPGLSRTSGYIGFLGHGDVLKFRNIRVKDLGK